MEGFLINDAVDFHSYIHYLLALSLYEVVASIWIYAKQLVTFVSLLPNNRIKSTNNIFFPSTDLCYDLDIYRQYGLFCNNNNSVVDPSPHFFAAVCHYTSKVTL